MSKRRAFTLVETLVVVVLISMAAALGAHSLSSASLSATWKAAEAAVGRFDARARMVARTTGPIEIAPLGDATTLVARTREGAIMMRLELPIGASATLVSDAGAAMPVLAIDRLGRSRDATYRIEIEGDARTLSVAGLTGQIGASAQVGGER